jgi:hypothetical protein
MPYCGEEFWLAEESLQGAYPTPEHSTDGASKCLGSDYPTTVLERRYSALK